MYDKIMFISVNNGTISTVRHGGTYYIKQHLKNNGIESSCVDYFYSMANRFKDKNYTTYVAEMADMPSFVKLLTNYKKGKDNLLDGLDELTGIQEEIISQINKNFKKIKITNKSIVGFSINYLNFFVCSYYALLIKKEYPDITIVFGGYQMTLSEKSRKFVIGTKIADYVVTGDGCTPMLDIINGKCLQPEIHGEFLDDCPWPEYSKFNIRLSSNTVSLYTSIGCPNNCSFCASKRKYKLYDLNKLKIYLDKMHKLGIKKIEFCDDNLNATLKRGHDVSTLMENYKLPKGWNFFGHVTNIDTDLANHLKYSGCCSIFLGTEGFTNTVTKLMHKNQTVEQSLNAIDLVASRKIVVGSGLIIGMPGDTEESVNYLVKMCENLKNKYGEFYNIIPTIYKCYPGSEIYNYPERFGITLSYWDKIYADELPEVADLILSIPKTFNVDKLSREYAIKILNMIRKRWPTKGI
jgi:radical SAM superfamily enzyme YgiQ (UPF0313 family)